MTDEQKAAEVRDKLGILLKDVAAIMTEAHRSNGLVINFQLATDSATGVTSVGPIAITKPVQL